MTRKVSCLFYFNYAITAAPATATFLLILNITAFNAYSFNYSSACILNRVSTMKSNQSPVGMPKIKISNGQAAKGYRCLL